MRRKPIHAIMFLWIIAWGLCTASYAAEESTPWYQVELILFSYKGADLGREKWPDDPGLPELSKLVEILDNNELAPLNGYIHQAVATLTPELADLVPRPYTLLKKEMLGLTREAQAIRRSSSRNLLLHTTWIQPVLARDNAPAVHIHSGAQYTVTKPMFPIATGNEGTTSPPPPVSTATGNSTGSNTAGATSDTGEQTITVVSTPPVPGVDPYVIHTVHEVEGKIQISISRYLHVNTDLMFYHPETLPDTTDPSRNVTRIRAYRFQDHRRMRSKELHYLDNPAFGLLILITPYELPKPEAKTGNTKP